MSLTILNQISKQVFLVRQFMMELKMIQTVFKYLVIDAVFIFIRFRCLLPSEIEK